MPERLKKSVLYTYGAADLCFNLMISMEAYFFAAFLRFSPAGDLIRRGKLLKTLLLRQDAV